MLTIGRFAPSPTGPLHFGSLVAATASYLAARHVSGRWLLRLEDIDKPREQLGAADNIILTLANYGFEWDEAILFQSQRLEAYTKALQSLKDFAYACTCSRKTLQQNSLVGPYGLIYARTCLNRYHQGLPDSPYAIRLFCPAVVIGFQDAIQGNYSQQLSHDIGDFVIKRADGLFAYQLAVVVDDAYQGVTQIVRGADLLDNTPRQIYLQQLLGYATPSYAHIPLVIDHKGQKLSKQNLAPALPMHQRLETLVRVSHFLGQDSPPAEAFYSLADYWDWAIAYWDINKVPRVLQCPEI